MHDALGRGALQFRLRHAQRLLRGGLVAGGAGRLDLLDIGAHARLPRCVALRALDGLTDALARRCGVRHGLSVLTSIRDEAPMVPKRGFLWTSPAEVKDGVGDRRAIA